MRYEVGYSRPTFGPQTMEYTIYSDGGEKLAYGYGFLSRTYLDQAVSMRMRTLRGLPPTYVPRRYASAESALAVNRINEKVAISGYYGGKVWT